jgi:hypothetical protein
MIGTLSRMLGDRDLGRGTGIGCGRWYRVADGEGLSGLDGKLMFLKVTLTVGRLLGGVFVS